MNEALEAARSEVQRLHEEREHYEETMKKAFMRGVCALNLEAMTMFNEADAKGIGKLNRQKEMFKSRIFQLGLDLILCVRISLIAIV